MERANWHAFALGQLTSAKDHTRIKRWCKDNLAGDHYVKALKETVGTRTRTIAIFVRVKEDDDALLFKLTWAGLE